MPSIEQHTVPVLYTTRVAGTPRPWLTSEAATLFSLANIGSYNQRLVNQLLSVCRELSHHIAFLPLLTLPSVKSLEREETLYANGEPLHTATTLECEDFATRQPSAAETQVVNEAIATIQYYQAVPLLSLTFTIRMLNRAMEELEVYSDASECLEAETDTYGKAIWRSSSETAVYYGLSADSTEYWAAIDLLQASIHAYAADKEITLEV